MPTESFGRCVCIDSDEAAQAMFEAMLEAEARGPVELPDVTRELQAGEEFAKHAFHRDQII